MNFLVSSTMRIYELSSVVASAEVEIEAGLEVVWELLSSIDHWPEWNADVRSAKIYGALAPGSIFVWRAGPMTITSIISQVQRPYLLAWTGKSLGIAATHTWHIESKGEGVLLRTEESWEGPFPLLFGWLAKKLLQGSIESWLQQLKAAAEKTAHI
jgi:hypothetical protein